MTKYWPICVNNCATATSPYRPIAANTAVYNVRDIWTLIVWITVDGYSIIIQNTLQSVAVKPTTQSWWVNSLWTRSKQGQVKVVWRSNKGHAKTYCFYQQTSAWVASCERGRLTHQQQRAALMRSGTANSEMTSTNVTHNSPVYIDGDRLHK